MKHSEAYEQLKQARAELGRIHRAMFDYKTNAYKNPAGVIAMVIRDITRAMEMIPPFD